jgi:hypothetical protein
MARARQRIPLKNALLTGLKWRGVRRFHAEPLIVVYQDAFSSREPEVHFARKRFRVSAGL